MRKKSLSGPLASGSNFDDPHVDEPGPGWHIGVEAAEQQYWKNTTDTAERSVYVCASFRRHAGRRLLRRQGGGAAQVHSKESEAKGVAETLQRLVLGEKE
jgi:hypothetical protein